MNDHMEIRWIKVGIGAGIVASIVYPVTILAPLPLPVAAALASFLGPAIGLGSLGLYRVIRLQGPSVAAAIAAIHNLIAGAILSAMILVQLAVRTGTPETAGSVVGVWLGLDVAWDVYIGIGTLAFAWAMIRHPRFRWPFAVSGWAMGLLLIVLNLSVFPTPPADGGLVDVGPLVGLWYFAATIQMWRSLPWAATQISRTSPFPAAVTGSQDKSSSPL
jgi:hypothetical protein